MKWISALFLFLCAATTVFSQPSFEKIEIIRDSGIEYVRIRDWAPACGLNVSWLKRDEQLRMTNRWAQIDLKVKSIMCKFNGLDVRLSLPIISRNGGIYVSKTDVENTLHPLLFPPKNDSRDKVRVICIDPGHGGKDTGKIDKMHQEKRHTLLLAMELGKRLQQQGFKVIYTRTGDQYVDLANRTAMANRYDADLFISLHYNSAGSRSVKGAEIYCLTPAGVESSNSGPGPSRVGDYTGNRNNAKNMLLAYTIQRSIVRDTGLQDRGIKRARFEVLRSAKMPAVLIEGGFMSNPDEARKIYDPAFRKKLAAAIADGVIAYRDIVEGRNSR